MNKTAQRRSERREQIWPGSEERMWPAGAGWFKAPRIISVSLLVLDHLVGKGKDLTRTYVDLLSRNWGEGFIDIADEEQVAFMVGFKTKRGRRTWTNYVKLLAKYGFVETRAVGGHALGAILMVDPLRVLCQLKVDGEVPDRLWQLLLHTCDTYAIPQLDLSEFRPTSEKKPESRNVGTPKSSEKLVQTRATKRRKAMAST